MAKWEYRQKLLPVPVTLDALSKLAALVVEGWEECGIEDGWDNKIGCHVKVFRFKRPKVTV